MRMDRVIVVGGGIVGASAAYHLAREGIGVVLVDRRDEGHATRAGAGIVAPGTSLRDLPAFYTLAGPAVAYYPDLLAALAEIGAGPTGYDVVGKLFLARNDEEAARLDEVYALFVRRRDEGMPNLGEIRMMEGDEARRLFPALRVIPRAIHISDAARVDGGLLRDALLAGARHFGAQRRQGEARLLVRSGRVVGVAVDGDTLEADAVVLAAGAWSAQLTGILGLDLPVAPQKGQILHILLPDQDTSRWPILGWLGSQYILSFPPNRVVAGATRETGSGFDTRVTPGGLHEVLATALDIAPGLANGTLGEVRVGLRPLSADGLPVLGRVPGHDNVVIATGHGPSGLQLGPYSGRLAAELATGRQPSSDLTPFAVDRPMPAGGDR